MCVEATLQLFSLVLFYGEVNGLETKNWEIKAFCPKCTKYIIAKNFRYIFDSYGYVENLAIWCPNCHSALILR